MRKRKKEAEEARMSEVKAERENYKAGVGFQLDSYIEEGREYYEFPPSDSMHRIIAKDEVCEILCDRGGERLQTREQGVSLGVTVFLYIDCRLRIERVHYIWQL